MRSTQQLSITLSNEMAEMVQQKVESGDYASVSEVIRDGLRSLQARDRAIEDWLRNDVVEGHKEYMADPSKGVEAKHMLETLKSRRKK